MSTDPPIVSELDALLLPLPDVTRRNMFGGAGYFAGDRLFAAFHKGALAAKLPMENMERLLRDGLAEPFTPTPGRPFGTWVQFAVSGPDDAREHMGWLKTAHEYVAATPPSGRRLGKR